MALGGAGALSASWKTAYSEQEVEYADCPLCGGADSEPLAEEWSLVVARCTRCGMEYARRRPLHAEWNYRPDEAALLAKYGPVIRGQRPHTREPNYGQILDRLQPYRGDSRLLDVGTHIGFFARAATRRGWRVVGVEQSPVLAELARREMRLDVREGYFHEFEFEAEFDAVTFLDVLEHVPDPVPTLERARRAVRPGGVVLVKVPHVKWNHLKHRFLKQLLGERVDTYDAREHLLQFREETLGDAFRRAGLTPLELFVPRPVQTGAAPRRTARWVAFAAGALAAKISGKTNALCPDLCLIGARPT